MLRRAAALALSAAVPRSSASAVATARPAALSLSLRSLHSTALVCGIDRATLLRRLSDEKARPSAGKARAAESAEADSKAKEAAEKAAIEEAWAKVEAEMQEEYERTGGASARPPTNARERAREQERRARGGGDQQRGGAPSSGGDSLSTDPKLRRRPRREPGANSIHRGKGAVKEEWPLERISQICRELLSAGRAGENLDPQLRTKYQGFRAKIEAEVTEAAKRDAESKAAAEAAAAAAPTAAAAAAAPTAASAATPSPSPASSSSAAPSSASASPAADAVRVPLAPSVSPPELRGARQATLDGISLSRDGALEYAFPRLNSFERHIVHTTAEFIGEGEITHGSVGEGLHRHIVLRYVSKEVADRNRKEKAEEEAKQAASSK